MKFFIINDDYDAFIKDEYNANPNLKFKKFEDQLTHRYNTLFGVSDFYSKNLIKLGHDAVDIITNNIYMQKKWAKENDIHIPKINTLLSSLPILRRYIKPKWREIILREQIYKYKPDVIYNMTMESVGSTFLNEIKKQVKCTVVGQHAAMLNESMDDLSAYDLIFSSLPNYVEYFRSKGLNSEYLQLGFEETTLDKLPNDTVKEYDVVCIGGFGKVHNQRNKVLEHLALQKDFKIDFWGYGIENLDSNSPILGRFHGFIGGLEMYQILQKSKICINGHVDIVAKEFANNMRLYEATGVGTLLLTDMKNNLGEIFDIQNEISTYTSQQDLEDSIRFFLDNPERLIEVSKAGQRRTLKDHNYFKRMEQMTEILRRYIK